MPLSHALLSVVLAIVLVSSGAWPVTASGVTSQAPLGDECEAQTENDNRVRSLFGPLLRRLAGIVGKTIGCIADAPDSGLAQRTSTGLLYSRPEGGGTVGIIVFTDGHRHWAVDANLPRLTLYWEGTPPYPPQDGVSRSPISDDDARAEGPWPPRTTPIVGSPTPTPTPAHRPATGEHITPPTFGSGRGTLTLKNDLTVDAAFKVRDADGARAARAFVYVRGGEQTTLEGVAPRTYRMQSAIGSDWDPDARIFRRVFQVMEMDTDVVFTETDTADGFTWVNFTVTLYPRSDGTFGGTSIDLSDFQRE